MKRCNECPFLLLKDQECGLFKEGLLITNSGDLLPLEKCYLSDKQLQPKEGTTRMMGAEVQTKPDVINEYYVDLLKLERKKYISMYPSKRMKL